MEQVKTYTEGTHRVTCPETTLRRVNPFLKQMGITRVANLTGLDNIGIPVIGVSRPNAKSLATSQGKGHSLPAAKVSGIMESIEGYHAENINLPIIKSSYRNLSYKAKVVSIDTLSRSCERDLKENDEISWIQCQTIRDKQDIWVPHEIIHGDFTVPKPEDHGYFIADSNGLASGNTILEAINHGLYEVIERDCMAIWHLTPPELQQNKRLDLDGINDEYLSSIINKLESKNIYIGVWDITNDLGIPTFICKMVANKNEGVRPAYGSGTHLNKNIALSRAITEAAQSRVTFIAGARDDQYHDVYEAEISEAVYQAWLSELTDIDGTIFKSFGEIPLISYETLEQDQHYVLEKLDDLGIKDSCYANLTKEEFGIPVVKVVVPGLEGVTHPGKRLLGDRALQVFEKYGVGACEMIS